MSMSSDYWEPIVARLEEEITAHKLDAERYRWLRQPLAGSEKKLLAEALIRNFSRSDLDDRLDAAMKEDHG